MASVIECFKSEKGDVISVCADRNRKTRINVWNARNDKEGYSIVVTEKELARIMKAMVARLTGDEA